MASRPNYPDHTRWRRGVAALLDALDALLGDGDPAARELIDALREKAGL